LFFNNTIKSKFSGTIEGLYKWVMDFRKIKYYNSMAKLSMMLNDMFWSHKLDVKIGEYINYYLLNKVFQLV
jgi:hypothetical protein